MQDVGCSSLAGIKLCRVILWYRDASLAVITGGDIYAHTSEHFHATATLSHRVQIALCGIMIDLQSSKQSGSSDRRHIKQHPHNPVSHHHSSVACNTLCVELDTNGYACHGSRLTGHSSAASLPTGPVIADPFISPFGLTICSKSQRCCVE